MSIAISGKVREWFNSDDTPMMQRLREAVKAHGRAVDDVAEMMVYLLKYDDGLHNGWKYWAPSPIIVFDVGFHDRTSLLHYWHVGRSEAVSYEVAKASLDLNRLPPSERRLFEQEGSQDGTTANPEAAATQADG